MKCKPNKFCETLISKLQASNNKGLTVLNLINIETGKPSRTLVVYKERPKDRGLCLNFCPWCGGSVIDKDAK